MTARSIHTCRFAVAALAVVLAFAAAPAAADPTFGPAFGVNRYAAAIQKADPDADVDDYVSLLAKGDRLTVDLVVVAGSALSPGIEILGPDGVRRSIAVRTARRGRTASIRNYRANASGPWTVRVSGKAGTTGAYQIAFRVTNAPAVSRPKVAVPATDGASVAFQAVDGTKADVTVAWKKGAPRVGIASILDPAGGDALLAAGGPGRVKVRGRTAEIRGLVLHEGHGAYALRLLGKDGAASACSVTIRLRPPARPSGAKLVRLDPVEPYLEVRSTPVLGIGGDRIRITGRHLLAGSRIVFGDLSGSGVTVYDGGTSIDVTSPAGDPGSTVAVAAIGPDGQACVRPAYFHYVPIPQIDVVTRDNGSPAPGWSTGGGLLVRLRGVDFREGQRVRFPGAIDVTPQIASDTEMTAVSPAGPAATDFLWVVDAWGRKCRSAGLFEMKTPPKFAAVPYDPVFAAENTDVVLSVRGTGFTTSDVVLVDGEVVPSQMPVLGTRTLTIAGGPAGDRKIQIRDRLGVVVDGPDFRIKPAPVVGSVAVVAGPVIGTVGIPTAGGTTLRVTGDHFDATDTILLGGNAAVRLSGTATTFDITAPAGVLGDADLVITDALGNAVTAAAVVRYVGFSDSTGTRLPAADTTDDLRAGRGAIGDLNGDGLDDLVLGAPAGASVGSRAELTRILLNDGAGALADATDWAIPAAGSDGSGADDWNAEALCVGDLDGDKDLDLVVAGLPPDAHAASGVRLFLNDGSAGFALGEWAAPAATAHAAIYAYDQYWYTHLVVGARDAVGAPSAVAIGDLDGDDRPEIVVGRNAVESEKRYIDPKYVDFTSNPPWVNYWDFLYYAKQSTKFHAGTRIYHNELDSVGVFTEVTGSALPDVGTDADTSLPALVCTDLALGDLDGDGDLDLVVAWNDPRTVTVAGLTEGGASAAIATRVLLNDGGTFTDETSAWMPSASDPDYRQADRIALTDLDGDGDPDLVLLSADGVDAWKGTPQHTAAALRILRNDGSGFTHVTGSAVPSLPTGDDFRGGAIAVRDVDGDGRLDLVVGSTNALSASGKRISSTRLLRQTSTMVFANGGVFLTGAATDTGEAADLCVGDLGGDGTPTLVLIGLEQPSESGDGAILRTHDWNR